MRMRHHFFLERGFLLFDIRDDDEKTYKRHHLSRNQRRCVLYQKRHNPLGISLPTLLIADSRVGWPNNFWMFYSYFLLKKEKYPISTFIQSLVLTKKSSKIFSLPLTDETLSLSFWPHKEDKWLFQFSSYHPVVMYLINSLAKSCTLFWKYS